MLWQPQKSGAISSLFRWPHFLHVFFWEGQQPAHWPIRTSPSKDLGRMSCKWGLPACRGAANPSAWRITIPLSKSLGSPPFRSHDLGHLEGVPSTLKDLLNMVINHLQVLGWSSKWCPDLWRLPPLQQGLGESFPSNGALQDTARGMKLEAKASKDAEKTHEKSMYLGSSAPSGCNRGKWQIWFGVLYSWLASCMGGEPNMFLKIETEGAPCSHFERGGDQKKQKETENHMMTFNADHNLMQYDWYIGSYLNTATAESED